MPEDKTYLKQLIINHSRRLQKLKEKQALKGIDTPPEILTEIEDIGTEIEWLQKELKDIRGAITPSSQLNILIVDNEPDVLTTISGSLADTGYNVRPVSNETQALEAIQQETFDFAIIDVRLKGDAEEDETGLVLALAIRNLNPQTRVIPITGFVRTKQIVRALQVYGLAGFIEKGPDMVQDILEAIDR